jgi:hypothetical protein
VPHEQTPATVVILVQVPRGTSVGEFTTLEAASLRRDDAVTWVVEGDDLTTLAAERPRSNWALAIDAAAIQSRQELRRRLLRARKSAPGLDCVVLAEGTPIAHRDLLVDSGIRTAVVGRFDQADRGNRRPAPDGWPCRSILWGLWEVETAPAKSGGMIGRLLPWSARPAAGSLTVVSIGGAGNSARDVADRLTREISRHTTAGQGTRVAPISDLTGLLGSGGPPKSGSVLRAA